jgi:hypothetical protein
MPLPDKAAQNAVAAVRRVAAWRETAESTADLSRSCFFIMPQVSKGREWTRP